MKSNPPPNSLIESLNDLSLLDIIGFILESWKTITVFTLLGVVGAVIYLWAVPKQYEAYAQIKMAQIPNITNLNPMGIYIEEPQALISRMAVPTSYPKEICELCGLADQKYGELVLASKVKFSTPKGVGGVVELKIRDASKESAKACANAVFRLIKDSQTQLIAPFIYEANKKLSINEDRLNRVSQVIDKADGSGAALSAAYLSTRDEIRFLLEQITYLRSFIAGSESHAAHLLAPIYVEDQPVFPKKRNSFLVGILMGGFLGLALALLRKWYQHNRTSPNPSSR